MRPFCHCQQGGVSTTIEEEVNDARVLFESLQQLIRHEFQQMEERQNARFESLLLQAASGPKKVQKKQDDEIVKQVVPVERKAQGNSIDIDAWVAPESGAPAGGDVGDGEEEIPNTGSMQADDATCSPRASASASRNTVTAQGHDRLQLMMESHDHSELRQRLRRALEHPVFDFIIGFFIIGNAVAIGTEVQYKTDHLDSPVAFTVLRYLFCVVFVAELLMRLAVVRTDLFRTEGWRWIIFDVVMVVVSVLEVIAEMMMEGESSTVLLTIRILRLLRIVRVMRFVAPLRIMIFTIFESFMHLFWLVILLAMILYVFSLCFTMAATTFLRDFAPMGTIPLESTQVSMEMSNYYGSVPRSLYTCFRAMTSGQSWGEVMDPLITVDPFYAVVFLLYIIFTIFALLNIVTGVFVNGALEKSQNEREMIVEKEMQKKQALVDNLVQIFIESDKDKSGEISREEFCENLENPRVEAYLSALQIDTTNMNDLFSQLDKDESGSITIHEFVENLVHLMRAQSVEQYVQRLTNEQHKMVYQVSKLIHAAERAVENETPLKYELAKAQLYTDESIVE